MQKNNIFTIDVEEWFHILDSPATPEIMQWDRLSLRAVRSLHKFLELLAETGNKATFFWLGWMAEKLPYLVRKCHELGHEIASHGYGHLLAYQVGPTKFKNDIAKGKNILEDITGSAVYGFRAPGFGIMDETKWAFDSIKEVGFVYDSSVFPGSRGHGGMKQTLIGPHILTTKYGNLIEIPNSVINIFGYRVSLFGGGYLRISPIKIIEYGIRKLKKNNFPVIIYVHPREVDPKHPRLRLGVIRKFKCYVNLSTTLPKLTFLCKKYKFCTMAEYAKKLMA